MDKRTTEDVSSANYNQEKNKASPARNRARLEAQGLEEPVLQLEEMDEACHRAARGINERIQAELEHGRDVSSLEDLLDEITCL